MHELHQVLAEVQETVHGVSPWVPVVRVKIFDEIDAVILEAIGIEAVKARDDVLTMMASIVDNEIERAELVHDSREKFTIGLTADSDVNPTGGRVIECACGVDIDADQAGIRMLEVILPKSQRRAAEYPDLEDTHRRVTTRVENCPISLEVVAPLVALWDFSP